MVGEEDFHTWEEDSTVVNRVDNDVVKLVIEMEQFKQPMQLEHYFKKTNTALHPSDEAGLISAYAAAAQAELLACMSADVTLVRYRVEDRISSGALNGRLRTHIGPFENVVGTIAGGAGTSDAPQLAAVVSWYTNFSGRGERGRSFVPGTAHTNVEDGALKADAVTLYQAWGDAVVDNFDGDENEDAPWQLVLWRQHMTNLTIPDDVEENEIITVGGVRQYRYLEATRPPFNFKAASHAITLAVVRPTIRTQRRRGLNVRISRSPRKTLKVRA